MNEAEKREIAERVRAACVRAALEGYEEGSIAGLCHDGAWEMAIGAMRMLDLTELLARLDSADSGASAG